MKKKKLIWKVLLIIGLMPFIVVIGYGIYSSIVGFTALCILNCVKTYGFIALRDSIVLISYLCWPAYIIGLILIIISIVKLKK